MMIYHILLTVIVTLMSVLDSPHKALRMASVLALNEVQKLMKSTDACYQMVIRTSRCKAEILADEAYITQVCYFILVKQMIYRHYITTASAATN